jgi:rfaE bifunctional protein nucleotidyltransferase chain/domain
MPSQHSRKTIPYEGLVEWRTNLPPAGRPLVVTNGCFDLIHPGHLFLLETARSLGKTLLVGVTGDEAVGILKGPGRPAMPERDRAFILSCLEAVTHVCLFPEVDAVGFLEKARPDVYVKGGDYTIETINQEERRSLQALGCRIDIVPRFESQSTTAVVQRILKGDNRSAPR